MKPDISVLIPTRGNHQRLAKCLAHLSQAQSKSSLIFEVMILDGAEDNAVVEDVLKPSHQVKGLHWAPVEAWWNYAQIQNYGVTLAKGRHVLFLDDDCYLPPDFFSRYQPESEETILGYLLVLPSGHVDTAGIDVIPNGYPNHRARYVAVEYLKLPPTELMPMVSFSCALVPRKVIDQVGELDTAFCWAYEDADYCLRAWQTGFKVMFHGEVMCGHEGGSSQQLRDQIFPKPGWELNFKLFASKWSRARLAETYKAMQDAERSDITH